MTLATFTPGSIPTQPGSYVAIGTLGTPKPALTEGVAATIFSASWGPLTPQEVSGMDQVAQLYGTGTGPETVREALRAGPDKVIALRAGTGGVVGTRTLQDTTGTPVNAVRLDAAYPGARPLLASITDNPSSPTTLRDLKVYELVNGANILRQVITFAKGSTGIGEPEALTQAVTSLNATAAAQRTLVRATKLADGNKTLATVSSPAALSGGTNPTADAAAYTTAMNLLASEAWNAVALDVIDIAIQASAAQWIADMEAAGDRRFLVLGEPTSVALGTRFQHAAAFNRWNVVYAANGFTRTQGYGGGTVEGALAAANLAGYVSKNSVRRGVASQVVEGAADLVGALGSDERNQAIRNGAVAYSKNGYGDVVMLYGVSTYVSLDGSHSASWKKILPTSRMYRVLDLVGLRWDDMLTADDGPSNTPSGREALSGAATAVIQQEEDLSHFQAGGRCYEDPSNPPTSDTAWFILEMQVADRIERVLLTANFA